MIIKKKIVQKRFKIKNKEYELIKPFPISKKNKEYELIKINKPR